jgi:AmmeMemoRadiSam system protein A
MPFTITDEEKDALLSDAAESIRAKLENRIPHYQRSAELGVKVRNGESALSQKLGAFVSLHIGDGRKKTLRGCIGQMASSEPLEETVRVMAIASAFGDPRFPPLTKNEFPLCELEISVLSPMEQCTDIRSIRIGVHGLYLSRNGRSGVFLPQVPVEQGWNLEQYLDNLCQKAGLPIGSHKEPSALLYTFTAEVFSRRASLHQLAIIS